MKLHVTPNDLHNNKIRSLLLLAKFEKNWKVGGEYAKDKEWFVKKNVSSFLDVCLPIYCLQVRLL